MREQELMGEIMIALSRNPVVLVLRVNSGAGVGAGGSWMRGAPAGTSDLILCVAGRFVAMEVKTPEGRQSGTQKCFQENVERRGGTYVIVRSVAEALAHAKRLEEDTPVIWRTSHG